MGWSFRKSFRIGPIRLNLSKSGVGVSTGVDGARISTGPRGTYASVSKYGIRYSKRIALPESQPDPNASPGTSTISPPAAQPVVTGQQNARRSRISAMVGHLTNRSPSTPLNKMQSDLQNKKEVDARMAEFRAVLLVHLTAKPVKPFDYDLLLHASGLNADSACEVAEKLFVNYARHAVADGAVSDQERAKLKQLAVQLHIDAGRAIELIRSARELG